MMRDRFQGSTRTKPASESGQAGSAPLPRSLTLVGASAAAACLLGLPAIAHADVVFTPPSGVTEYRLIFVTSDSIAATSSDIADYNTFATAEAALNASLPSTLWTAVASTNSISAASNIACTPDCSNIPIFLVDGTEVAESSTALFNSASVTLLNGIDEDENGNEAGGYVWTGSNPDGTSAGTDALGGSDGTMFGDAGAQSSAAFSIFPIGSDNDLPIYAISGVIDAPEPVSASLLGLAGIATGLASRFKRRRKSATAG